MELKSEPAFGNYSGGKDEWLTPPEIIRALGDFDLDPCAPVNPPWPSLAKRSYTIEDDGLSKPWEGRVWLNPPYGRETPHWISRLADHGWGIALTFARPDTGWFHDDVFQKAAAIFFFRGRLKFYNVDGTLAKYSAPAPSCLIGYGLADSAALLHFSTVNNGYLVFLR